MKSDSSKEAEQQDSGGGLHSNGWSKISAKARGFRLLSRQAPNNSGIAAGRRGCSGKFGGHEARRSLPERDGRQSQHLPCVCCVS